MRLLLLFTILLFSCTSISLAKEIRVAFGQSVPPYINQETNDGIEMDIIKEAFKLEGYTIKPIYIPFIEILDVFSKDIAEAAATVEEKIGIDGIFSDHVITYHNYAISLRENDYDIKRISDLRHYSVSSFQLARKYLGSEFAQMAHNNPRYRERKRQISHVKLLLNGKLQVVVTDNNIFKYYANQIQDESAQRKVVLHDLFPPNHYKMVFKDKNLRDAFNRGLKSLKESGRYDEIFDTYLKRQ